ncbi:MAG: orotidine-5'-phosphate decarboxylase [Bacteroidia bacterium]
MGPGQLAQLVESKQSALCVALDFSESSVPLAVWHKGLAAVEAYAQDFITQTAPHAIAYKINTAFYEAQGAAGWALLERIWQKLPSSCMRILDVKRSDVPSTTRAYQKAFFSHFDADAVTLNPYLGVDALEPFLDTAGKWVFLLLRTSNVGAAAIQNLRVEGLPLWHRVYQIFTSHPHKAYVGWVVGATLPTDELQTLRRITEPDWLLVPGIGAQGGKLPKGFSGPFLYVVGRALLQNPAYAPVFAQESYRIFVGS